MKSWEFQKLPFDFHIFQRGGWLNHQAVWIKPFFPQDDLALVAFQLMTWMSGLLGGLPPSALRIDQETDQLEIQEEAKTIVNADRRSFIEAKTSVLWVFLGSVLSEKYCCWHWFFGYSTWYDLHTTQTSQSHLRVMDDDGYIFQNMLWKLAQVRTPMSWCPAGGCWIWPADWRGRRGRRWVWTWDGGVHLGFNDLVRILWNMLDKSEEVYVWLKHFVGRSGNIWVVWILSKLRIVSVAKWGPPKRRMRCWFINPWQLYSYKMLQTQQIVLILVIVLSFYISCN